MPRTQRRAVNHLKRAVSEYHTGLFGETFLRRAESPVFTCGDFTITLHQLATELDYPFPMSARLLERVCKTNHIRTLKQLFDKGLHGLASLHGVGDSLCAVATIILDHKGFDLYEFCGWDDATSHVRFSTMKIQQRAQQEARKKKYHKVDRKHLPSDFVDAAAEQATMH